MRFEFIQETGSNIPIPGNYKDSIELIRSDYYRYKGRKTSIFMMWVYSMLTSNFGFNFWIRLASVRGWLMPIAKFMHRMYYLRYGLQITPKTKIGYGFYIGHGFGTFVNPSAIIGNNCNISQCSTIGANLEDAAIIGDNVYIGSNVCVIGHIVVQNTSSIGAGAVVVKDVPENATVAGVPAKVISYENPGRFVENRWPLKRNQ